MYIITIKYKNYNKFKKGGVIINTNNKSNKLINESSPYLLQHAYNFVDWYPWGEEAFKKAKDENKPIFLSIGYSTCHWCHVMSHESFENEYIGKRMNEVFINIKVDREERPDIDNIFMRVCQMFTGSGGWPLSIVLTPDKNPFFAATYIPKFSHSGRIGMAELMDKIENIWENEPEKLMYQGEIVRERLSSFNEEISEDRVSKDVIEKGVLTLKRSFDKKYGGFREKPKFPSPHNLLFLLREYKEKDDKELLNIVTTTLDNMMLGGIYDHIGYGFHRYSTDRKWLLPHFEKMLYDQSMLILAYTEAYEITKNESYKKIVEETIEYVFRVLSTKEGAFFSAEDADSEGEEGKFYVWTIEELKEALDNDEVSFISKVYNLKEEGNFKDEATGERTGANIFYLKEEITKEDKEKISSIKEKLFSIREKRIHPHMDDKVLTDWNGLFIAALSKASFVFNREDYSKRAENAIEFFLNSYKNNKGLYHSYCKGEWKVLGNIDDYSFLIFALIELYEVSFKVKYLKFAIELTKEMIKEFWDNKNGGFYFTQSKEELVLARTKETYDGAIPSGNSIAYLNLIKLEKLTGDDFYSYYIIALEKNIALELEDNPNIAIMLLTGIQYNNYSPREITIVGKKDSEDVKKALDIIREIYLPNTTIVVKDKEDNIEEIADYTKYQNSLDNKVTVYICKNYSCSEGITNIDKIREMLL
ncbi:thioredoxin domain-containing protein [Clostridium carnis]